MGEEISAEPAARYLLLGESWRPRTWKHFRFNLLRYLQDNGAHTLSELRAAPPAVLFLPLNRAEVLAVLDSARRRGEVVRLSLGTGPIAPSDEWVVSDGGRRAIRHGLPWMVGNLPKPLTTAAALLGSVGLGKVLVSWLTESDGATVAVVAEVLVIAVFILGMLLVALRSRAVGVSAQRSVSRDWKRWATERPEWHEIATEPFPWAVFGVALALFVASILIIQADPDLRNLGTHPEAIGLHVEQRPNPPYSFLLPEALALVPFWIVARPLWAWMQRWATIAAKAKEG